MTIAIVVIVAVIVVIAAFAIGMRLGSRPAPPEPASAAPAPPAPATPAESETPDADTARVEAIAPGALPTFTAVGGMTALKAELTDAFDVLLHHADEAASYHLTFNGILLHGPPGVGKTFLAHATAGQFGLTLVPVSAADLLGATRAESARNVDDVFAFAAAHRPTLLFFDEFDAIAERRDDSSDLKHRAVVSALVAALERTRDVHDLIVMAATNRIDDVDPAVIRPGHFDRQIRVDLADRDARAAIFRACLANLPLDASVDFDDLARRSDALTPAAIANAVRTAALDAFTRARRDGGHIAITQDALVAGLDHGGHDRPTIEDHSWDSVILEASVKDQLRELQYVIEDRDAAVALGIDPPSGILLAGPPGNGKTTVAKVLAAQAQCSFYPISAADITSKWFGESEHNIARLFERARENRPSIVFIDEVDGIAARRGGGDDISDRLLTELLEQIDGMAGQRGILVIGATNRPDQIDPALLRGGRLSRTIAIPAPDEAGRLALLQLFTAKMPLTGVDLHGLAAVTEGWSGGDLRALCQDAALCALVAARARGEHAQHVSEDDFERALEQRTSGLGLPGRGSR